MIKLPKVPEVDKKYPANHIFDFTKDNFDFPDHNGEENIFKARHQRIFFDHQIRIEDLKMKKICDKNCKHKKEKPTCAEIFKKESRKICPKNCNCKHKCLCGWEPDKNLSEKDKNKQITKHFKMCVRLEYLGEPKERSEHKSVNTVFL